MSVIIGLLVTYIVAAVNNIAKIFANENQSTITNVMAFGVVFAVIGATVFSVLLLQRWRNRDGEKETTIPFYKQSDLHRLPEFLSKGTELYLVGITLQELQQTSKTITNALRKPNGKVNVLVCDPHHRFMRKIEQVVYGRKKTVKPLKTGEKISSTLSVLENVKHDDSLSELQINSLQIRTHELIPTHTLVILDPSSDSAVMQVEPYPFGIDREERRVFRIYKRKQAELFNIYWQSFQNMWVESTPIPPNNPQ